MSDCQRAPVQTLSANPLPVLVLVRCCGLVSLLAAFGFCWQNDPRVAWELASGFPQLLLLRVSLRAKSVRNLCGFLILLTHWSADALGLRPVAANMWMPKCPTHRTNIPPNPGVHHHLVVCQSGMKRAHLCFHNVSSLITWYFSSSQRFLYG